MKKIDIINLIKASVQNDSDKFREIADSIANEFYESGDKELGDTVFSFVHNGHTLVPQSNGLFLIASPRDELVFLTKKEQKEITKIINSINKNSYPYIFNFEGDYNKNIDCAKIIAKSTNRELYFCLVARSENTLKDAINFINNFVFKDRVIFYLQMTYFQIDDKTKYLLGNISKNNAVIISNVGVQLKEDSNFKYIALYGDCKKQEAIEIALNFYGSIVSKYNIEGNTKLVKKILLKYTPRKKYSVVDNLSNKIEYAIASSNLNNEKDYYKMLIKEFDNRDDALDIKKLHKKGFSLREIESITGISKSRVGERLKK